MNLQEELILFISECRIAHDFTDAQVYDVLDDLRYHYMPDENKDRGDG